MHSEFDLVLSKGIMASTVLYLRCEFFIFSIVFVQQIVNKRFSAPSAPFLDRLVSPSTDATPQTALLSSRTLFRCNRQFIDDG